MKEALVMSALKLQVANKLIQSDELVISALRKDAAEAKKLSVVSAQKEADAAELVESLRVEISALKRQVREKTDEASRLHTTAATALTISDAEVDQMMALMIGSRPSTQATSFGDSARSSSRCLTPFNDWKLQHYIWSPDIPRKEEFDAEKERRSRGEGEDPRMITQLLDETFINTNFKNSTRNKKRPPSTPFGNAMEMRTMTAGSNVRTLQSAGGTNKSSNDLLSSKFPGISKIRQRVATAQQINPGVIDNDFGKTC